MNERTYRRVFTLVAVLVLALVSTACGNVKLPVTKIDTGPTQTADIQVPMPSEASTGVVLNLEFLAGKLNLAPGSGEGLASGTAKYNAVILEPKVTTDEPVYTLRQGEGKFEGIPKFEDEVVNEWDLKLADTPMSLNVQAGAYDGSFELGGLSLENLSISEGGSNLTGTFSKPNQIEMSSFKLSTGGSKMVLNGLANANFEQMVFDCGAGDYTLSFDGALQRDASVTIEAGAGSVTLVVPQGVDAQVTFEGGLSSVKADAGWSQNESVYTLSGSGPTITIKVKMGLGTLNLKTA